jgi:hypothetical protein
MSYIIVQVPEEPDLEKTTPLLSDEGERIEEFDTFLEAQEYIQLILRPFFGNHIHGLEILRMH